MQGRARIGYVYRFGGFVPAGEEFVFGVWDSSKEGKGLVLGFGELQGRRRIVLGFGRVGRVARQEKGIAWH